MSQPIIIIGSGFAAYQLIKTIRRSDNDLKISVFTSDDGHDYNKPDLSHVFSKQQQAQDLVTISAQQFADDYQVDLHTNALVEVIDKEAQQICVAGVNYPYSKLVIATGAKAFVPPMQGDATEQVLTLNSLTEFANAQSQLSQAQSVLVIGGGLIGTEVAMDLNRSGKKVTVVDPNAQIMATMLPDFVATPLQREMSNKGVQFKLNNSISSLQLASEPAADEPVTDANHPQIVAHFKSGDSMRVGAVIAVAGLKANIQLAQQAGLETNRGIIINAQLQTSANNIFALGDCAEFEGQVRAYLQPIVIGANILAKVLLGESAQLALPTMLVKVKTPDFPIQLAGKTNADVDNWQVHFDKQGCIAKAFNKEQQNIGFIVTQEHMQKAFPLLREIVRDIIRE